jgi:CubicO group peptidase (beta-lactamase class C family)
MKTIVSLLIVAFSLIACNEKKERVMHKEPKQIKGGWEISTPEKEGFNKKQLEEVIANVSVDNPKLDGLLIARNNKLIVEEYFNGYSTDKLHKVWSITKAVTGTTLGIAVDKGLISQNDSIYKHLKNYTIDSTSTARGITVEHLITMTSGYKWVEMGGRQTANFKLPYSQDWIEHILSQPHILPVGTKYNYSTGNTLLLAPIIKNATGKQVSEFAQENLFTPLAITNYTWYTQSEFWTKQEGDEIPNVEKPAAIEYKKPFADLTNTGSGLFMRPRDMCKIGQLYLNKGKWDGEQVLSEDWIVASTQPHFNNKEYGYHWRLGTFEGYPYYYATGFGVQRIVVFPTLNMVIVLTQQHYTTMQKGNVLTNNLLREILATVRDNKN